MASSYFVTFGDNRLTFPGATGSVAWEYNPLHVNRYEYTLWESPNRIGQSSGTLASSTKNFDEILIGLSWKDSVDHFGVEYKSFPANVTTNATCTRMFGYSSTYYMYTNVVHFDNSALKWSSINNSANRWFISSPATTTASWTTGPSSQGVNRLSTVAKIIGVKYS